jgi:hypothetical protein
MSAFLSAMSAFLSAMSAFLSAMSAFLSAFLSAMSAYPITKQKMSAKIDANSLLALLNEAKDFQNRFASMASLLENAIAEIPQAASPPSIAPPSNEEENKDEENTTFRVFTPVNTILSRAPTTDAIIEAVASSMETLHISTEDTCVLCCFAYITEGFVKFPCCPQVSCCFCVQQVLDRSGSCPFCRQEIYANEDGILCVGEKENTADTSSSTAAAAADAFVSPITRRYRTRNISVAVASASASVLQDLYETRGQDVDPIIRFIKTMYPELKKAFEVFIFLFYSLYLFIIFICIVYIFVLFLALLWKPRYQFSSLQQRV